MTLNYFDISEFDSPDLKGSGELMNESFLVMLDRARHIAETPFRITSGYRTKEHNSTLAHSVPDSAHTKGYAVDISAQSSREKYLIVSALIKAGFNRLGIASNFIHVDSDPDKPSDCIWTY